MSVLLFGVLLTAAVIMFSLWLSHKGNPRLAEVNDAASGQLKRTAGLLKGPIEPVPPSRRSGPPEETLKRICRAVGYEDMAEFMAGAKLTYELVLDAFSAGDLRDCRLLAADVHAVFMAAITEREAKGETLSTMFIGFRSADILDAGLGSGIAWIEVRFVAQMVSVTRDRDGKVIAGHPDRVVEIAQRWTFQKELRSADRQWLLVATAAEE